MALTDKLIPPKPLIDPRFTVQLVELELRLAPKDPRLIHEPRDQYDSDEEHARAVAYAQSTAGRIRCAIGVTPETLGGGRWVTGCPACGLEGDLIYEVNGRAFRAACMKGCDAKAIADAITRAISADESRELGNVLEVLASAEDAAAQTLAAEMDVTAIRPYVREWSVPLIALARASNLLVGESGDGKTWLMIYAAICKALGVPFLGHRVERGRALLCLLESHEINSGRIEYIVQGLGHTMAELRGWLDVWPVGLDLKTDNAESRAELARRVRARQYAWIGIDNATKARSSRAQNAENDSSVLSAVLEPLAELANNGTIDGQRVTDSPPSIVTLVHGDGRPRGSSAQPQHVDYVVALHRDSQRDPESPITLDIGEGCRVVNEDLPLVFRSRGVIPDPVTFEIVGESAPPTEDRLEKLVQAVRREPGIGVNAIARACGGSKRDVARDLEALVKEKRLRRDDSKKFHAVD